MKREKEESIEFEACCIHLPQLHILGILGAAECMRVYFEIVKVNVAVWCVRLIFWCLYACVVMCSQAGRHTSYMHHIFILQPNDNVIIILIRIHFRFASFFLFKMMIKQNQNIYLKAKNNKSNKSREEERGVEWQTETDSFEERRLAHLARSPICACVHVESQHISQWVSAPLKLLPLPFHILWLDCLFVKFNAPLCVCLMFCLWLFSFIATNIKFHTHEIHYNSLNIDMRKEMNHTMKLERINHVNRPKLKWAMNDEKKKKEQWKAIMFKAFWYSHTIWFVGFA